MTSRSLRAWYAVHKWTSLVCTLFLLLLCVTGLPLIFYHELDHALGYTVDPPAAEGDGAAASVDRMVARAQTERPDEELQFLWQEEDAPHTWFLSLGVTADAEDASSIFLFDARTGDLFHEYPVEEGPMYIFWKLHVEMFAGLPGTLFLGAMGLLFVASLVSGAVVYGPFMQKLPFATVRSGLSTRTRWLDLHNLLGIVTLAWALVVGFTGAVNTLALPLLRHWQGTELAEMIAPYRGKPPLEDVGSTDAALAAARAATPGHEVSFVAFPGNGFAGPHHYGAFMRGTTPLTSRLLVPVLVDARTAEVTDQRELPWYLTALLVSQPLHFGDYGGMPMKILWALLDLVTIVVLGSGLYLWWVRGAAPVERRLEELERAEAMRAAG